MNTWPKDYLDIHKHGIVDRLLDPDDPLMVWDAEFLSSQRIDAFEPLDDQVIEIRPFARTGSGDYWAYPVANLPSTEIALCYRDSYEAEYYANDLSSFVFRQTIAFAGCEGFTGDASGWSFEDAKLSVSCIRFAFEPFMSDAMLHLLQQIENVSMPYVENGWATLISEQSARQTISRMCTINRDVLTFEWRA